jgi:hypothetical protein
LLKARAIDDLVLLRAGNDPAAALPIAQLAAPRSDPSMARISHAAPLTGTSAKLRACAG